MAADIPKWLDEGAGMATCNLLTAGSAVAAGYAVRSALTLQMWPTLGLAGASAAMGALASAMNCNHNAGEPAGSQADCPISGGWNASGVKVFRAATTAKAISSSTCQSVRETTFAEQEKALLRFQGAVSDVVISDLAPNGCGFVHQKEVRVLKAAGGELKDTLMPGNPVEGFWQYGSMQAIVRPYDGGAITTAIPACNDPGDVPLTVYNYNHTDPATGCSYNYELQDSWIASDGLPRFAWAVDGTPTPTAKAGCQGGRITGYVWAPTTSHRHVFNPDFNFGGPGGPGGRPPWDFVPDWGSLMDVALKVMSFNDPGDFYRLVSVCETDSEGEPISRAVEVDIPPGVRDAGASTRVRLQAIVQLLQGLKDFKQPICPPEKPHFTGEWVSVQFVSEQASLGGEKPLRKKFRYRDQTFAPLEAHVDHWLGFEWEAGPVCVISRNLPWGVPQVWAATAAEGKRVISHAAQIAGVDLADTRHAWIVTGSGDPRYGQTGRMRVDTRGGQFVRVTKRPGPGGLPSGVAPDP